MIMRWCNLQTKVPVFQRYICNRWQNIVVQPSQTHSHGKIYQWKHGVSSTNGILTKHKALVTVFKVLHKRPLFYTCYQTVIGYPLPCTKVKMYTFIPLFYLFMIGRWHVFLWNGEVVIPSLYTYLRQIAQFYNKVILHCVIDKVKILR